MIATAASLGESVSLHLHLGKKVCSNAIYLDRNFNGAQFMQSMDRIHRIGMLPETVVNYHLIVAKNTIILQRTTIPIIVKKAPLILPIGRKS